MNSMEVYQMIKKHFEANKLKFEARDDDLALILNLQGEDLPQPTILQVMDDRKVIHIVSPIPSRMPEDKRLDAAVAVAVANSCILNGAFEFNMNDGSIKFRVTQSYVNMDISEELIKYMISVAFYTTDKFNDKFFMLSKGMMNLEQFIEQAQQK